LASSLAMTLTPPKQSEGPPVWRRFKCESDKYVAVGQPTTLVCSDAGWPQHHYLAANRP